MKQEKLSLNEFVIAQRKPAPNRLTPDADKPRLSAPVTRSETPSGSQEHVAETNDGDVAPRIDARKALRRMKRERVKGVQSFVNVHLDRETKKRLKLASFTSEISMQSIMETAITKFLDNNGF